MPFIKIGQSTFNNETSAVMLLQGKATRDAENRPVNGKEHTQVSIAAGEDKSGNELYITLNGWRQNAELVGAIKKGDSILAIGRLKTREYNGNIYNDLDADFLIGNAAGINVPLMYADDPGEEHVNPATKTAEAFAKYAKENAERPNDDMFSDVGEDEGLPF